MRYTCCSNFRQGGLFQASLVGSTWASRLSFGAFLFAILLTFYFPYSRVHVSLSSGFPRGLCFLDHLSAGCIGWHLLTISTICESYYCGYHVPTLCFLATVDVCYPPDASGWMRLTNGHQPPCVFTFWFKPLNLFWLVSRYDG